MGGGKGDGDGDQQVGRRPHAEREIEEHAGGQEDQPAAIPGQQVVGPGGQGQEQQEARAVDGHGITRRPGAGPGRKSPGGS